jgi:hypothetical protein
MSQVEYEALRKLVERDDCQNEVDCRQYLKYAQHLFVTETPKAFLTRDEEYRGNSGDSDLIVTCRVQDGVGQEAIRAYVWEVKAPQSHLFEFDTKNRVKPSAAYVSAENQLLHYYDELFGSDQFLREHHIADRHNVMLGGILIGRDNTSVKQTNKNSYDPATEKKLFARALRLRVQHLYGHVGIRVLTWDTILDHLKSAVSPPHQQVLQIQPPSISPPPANTTIQTST